MTSSSWREHPEARTELLAEADRLPIDVAEHLVLNASAAIEDIIEGPESWPKVPFWNASPTLRRRRIRPFRINVVYYVVGDEVRVIAYAHQHRQPDYWMSRIDESDC